MAYPPCIFATKLKSKNKNKNYFIRINPIVGITEEDAERVVKELRSEYINY